MEKGITIRVNKIESFRDQNGQLGKKIDLVEEHEDHQDIIQQSEEEKIVNNMMLVMEKTMPMQLRQQMTSPKIVLYLTEQECDSLGVTFDVNQTYQVTFEGQTIKFSKGEQ